MADLPQLDCPLEDMTESELKSFIPKMIREATGRTVAGYGKKDLKPIWWPKYVAWCNPKYDNRQRNKSHKTSWTQILRGIIKACYEHYGHENLLKGGSASGRMTLGSGASGLKVVNNDNGSVTLITDDTVLTVEDRSKSQFRKCSEVSIEAAIPSGTRIVMNSGAAEPAPTRRLNDRAALPQQSRWDSRCSENADEAEDRSMIEIFICFYCENEFKGKAQLQNHQSICDMRPNDIKCFESPRQRGDRLSKQKLLQSEHIAKPNKSNFVEFLGLIPIGRAEKLKNMQSKEKEIACYKIEVEDEAIPKTPTTPRTPKSLISQLSRDVSPPAVVRRLDAEESFSGKQEKADDSGSECGKSDNGEEDIMKSRKIHSLLAIDISSALGQRIKKHLPEADKDIIIDHACTDKSGYEEFCHTPVKNESLSRLRHRDNTYPVTWRPKRRPGKFSHEYSFNKAQRNERYKVLRTGLSRRSRALKRSVKNCGVQLEKISPQEIKEWTRRRPGWHMWSNRGLKDPGFLMSPGQLQQMLRLQGGDISQRGPLRFLDLTQLESDSTNAEIQRQRATIYKRLLNETALRHSRSVNPNSDSLTPPGTPDPSSPLQQLLHSQRQQSQKSGYFSPSRIHPVMSNMINGPSYTAATPRNGFRPRTEEVDCDVISISSSEDEEVLPPAPLSKKRKRASEKSSPIKKARESAKLPSALLFRCHMCHVEITCKQNAAQTIKAHFVNIHGVSNIDLVEHNDDKGQKVVSIVEVSVPRLNPATPPDMAQPALLESAATTRPNVSQRALQNNNNAKSQTTFMNDPNRASRKLFGNQRRPLKPSGQIPRYQGTKNAAGAKSMDDDDIICLD